MAFSPRAALLGAALLLPACAAPAGVTEWDPWEDFNRDMFWVNDRLDAHVVEPLAQGWKAITSPRVRESVADFGSNLAFPVRFVNDLLQLRLFDAGRETARFVVNTTVGLLGFFDPATGWGMPLEQADFGQTLAVWGVEEGPYLVLPFFGPSNPRDAVGWLVDLDVVTVLPTPIDGHPYLIIGFVVVVNWRARHMEDIEEARAASFDYYAAVRSAWLAARRRDTGTEVPVEQQETDPYEIEEDPYDVDAATVP